MYGSNDVNKLRENIQKSKDYVKSNALYLTQEDFDAYRSVLVLYKVPSDEELNKNIINERKKEYASTKNEELKEEIKEMKLSLKWKKYVTKKTNTTRKSLAKIYKVEVARNGGNK